MNSVTTTKVLDNLIVGVSADDIVTDAGTLITGQNLTRGAVLGKITASGKLTICDKAAVDGSAVPFAILADDMDATSADKSVVVYLAGSFNQALLTFKSGTVAADVKDLARGNGMYFINVYAAA